jgi:hypothetical protein
MFNVSALARLILETPPNNIGWFFRIFDTSGIRRSQGAWVGNSNDTSEYCVDVLAWWKSRQVGRTDGAGGIN